MTEEELLKNLYKLTNCSLREAYDKVLHYCKTNGYTLADKCRLLRKVFNDQQVEILMKED